MRGKNLKTTSKFKKIMSLLLLITMMMTYMPATFIRSVYAAAGAGDGQIEYIGGTNSVYQSNGAPFDITVSKTIEAVKDKENYFDITLRTKTRRHSLSEETDVVFVLDISNTMNADENDDRPGSEGYEYEKSRIYEAKVAIKKFIDEYATNTRLDEGRRVGIVTFNTNANVKLGLTECNDIDDANSIYDIVDDITAPEDDDVKFTNIEGGLQLAHNVLKESTADHKYIILLTDGFPTTYVNQDINGNKESKNSITGYDTYMSRVDSTYDESWESLPGHFAYTLGDNGVKVCQYGVDYSNKAALRVEEVSSSIKASGINIFSVGFDIGVQSVTGYIDRWKDESFSTVDTTGMSSLEDCAIGTTAESYQKWLEDTVAGGILLNAMGENANTFSHGTDLESLKASFAAILRDIEIAPEVTMRNFYTLDPMSDKVEFMYFLDQYGNPVSANTLVGESKEDAENTASYGAEGHEDEIYWDLLNSGYTTEPDQDGTEWLVFDITYRVRLENEYFTESEWETAFETNNRIENGTEKTTDLYYESTTQDGIPIPEKSSKLEYPVPQVEGYEGELKFKKVDEETGQTLEGAKFTLQHYGDSCSICQGDAEIEDIIKTSDANGIVEFTQIPSGHNYVLLETEAPDGYKAGSGTAVIVSYGETYIGQKSEGTKLVNGNLNNTEFIITNGKIEPLALQIQVNKTIDGNIPEDGKFKFLMTGKGQGGADFHQIAYNDKDGLVTFKKMVYDTPGTYEFTISEVVGEDKSIVYDGKVYNIKIIVSEDKTAGVYNAEIFVNDNILGTYTGEEDKVKLIDIGSFVNTTRSDGKIQLVANKTMLGVDYRDIELKGDEFTFKLTGDGIDGAIEVKNDKDGNINFGEFTYDKEGTYTYKISEVMDQKYSNIYYDRSVYTATVKVTAPNDLTDSGSFETEVTYKKNGISYEGTPEFINKERKAAKLELQGLKTLNGMSAGKDEFSFVMVDLDQYGNEIEETARNVKNDENGLINFETLVFDNIEFNPKERLLGKVYKYKIYEVKGPNENIEYDDTYYELRVIVEPSLDSEQYVLDVVVERVTADTRAIISYKFGNYIVIGKTGDYDIHFTNTSTEELNLTARKTMDGRIPENEKFTFILEDEQGKTLQSVKNDAEGNIAFDAIKYTATDVGTHKYVIYENTSKKEKDNNPEIIYDETIYTVEVEVSINEDGNLIVSEPVIEKNGSLADEILFENTKVRGSIKVIKFGEENNPLEGAEFTIYNKSDINFKNPLETKTTDANGQLVFENYEYGDYVVRETKAPEGYNLEGIENALSKDVSITENLKVYELEYSNTKIRGSVKVVKFGEENDPLEGAEFTIYNKSDINFENPLKTKATDENGQVIFENLEYGDYVIRETKAPEGYNLEVVGDETSQNREVSITENLKVYELEYSNTKIRGSIEITKFGENADTLEGVEFTLYEKADSEFKNPILVAITDDNGIAKFENVQYGEYVIKETKEKAGYNNSDKTVEINVLENEALYKATFENTKIRGSIEVIKKDDKGRVVAGTEFTLYSYDDVNFENPLHPPVLTDENGRVKFENVEYGRYIVKETKAAEGYLIPEVDTQVVIVTENGVNYISEFIDEVKKGDIVITKVSEDGTLLSDVEFTLYSYDDINFENPLKTVITGNDGLAIFENVEYGKYKVKETKAKEGYNLSNEVLEVNVNEHGKIYDFEVINTKIIGEILATKISNVTKLPLEGAEFALYSINDKEFKYPLGFAISDENGKISFKNVEYGRYLLKEIKAPEGYYLMKEAIEVNITEHGAIYEFEIENKKMEDSIVSSGNNSNDTITTEKLPGTGDVLTTGIKLAVAISVAAVGITLLKKKK